MRETDFANERTDSNDWRCLDLNANTWRSVSARYSPVGSGRRQADASPGLIKHTRAADRKDASVAIDQADPCSGSSQSIRGGRDRAATRNGSSQFESVERGLAAGRRLERAVARSRRDRWQN